MKKLMVAAFTVMCLIGLVGTSAFATTVKFTYADLFGWGRTYTYNAGANNWLPNNLNPFDGSAGQVMPDATYVVPDGHEDSFTVNQVEKITTGTGAGAQTIWSRVASGHELTVVGYGFDDFYNARLSPTLSTLQSTGGHIEIWLDTTPDYDPAQGIAGRNIPGDYSHYDTVTDDGELVLSLAAHPDPANNVASINELANFGSMTFFGNMYMDVIGGTWASTYDTNGMYDGADFEYSWSSFANCNGSTCVADWLVWDDSSSAGNLVPEPATLLLLGMGLIGLGLGRRYGRD